MPDLQYTVSELSNKIKYSLEESFRNIKVIGEVSNLHHHSSSGHIYFTLKDNRSELKTVMFKSRNSLLNFKIKDGTTIFTPNNEIHSCHFPVNTKMVVSSGFPRDQKTYEADTVRVDFINKENLQKMIEIYGKK